MAPHHQEIHNALLRWGDSVRSSDAAELVAALGRLDQLRERHARVLEPQLAHFLERRSYQKAQSWLAREMQLPA
jgi:RNA polymerase-interacting CarD/CdnL/TRCF family regulator